MVDFATCFLLFKVVGWMYRSTFGNFLLSSEYLKLFELPRFEKYLDIKLSIPGT